MADYQECAANWCDEIILDFVLMIQMLFGIVLTGISGNVLLVYDISDQIFCFKQKMS